MRFRTLVPVVSLLLVVAACGAGGGGSPGASPGGSGEAIEIDEDAVTGTVRFSGFRSSDAEEELLQATLDDFAAKYPNIEVQYEPIPEGYVDQMTAQFSAGEPPDLFYMQAEFANAWIEDGLIEPLDPYFAGNPEFDTGPFFDPLLAAFQFEGQTYGLPKDASPLALFTNPDLLSEASVDVPTTWDELRSAAEALTTDEVAGLCIGSELPRIGALIYQAGGGIYSEDKTELTIANPESVEGIDFYLELHDAGTLQTPADIGAGWCGEAFGQVQAAMTMEGNWLIPAMENDFPDTPFEVAELPEGAQKGNLAFTVSYSIGTDSPNKEAAWVLLQYLTGPEGMASWTGQGLALPSRDDVEPAPGREALVAGLEYATAYAFERSFPDVQGAFNNELTRVLAEGGTGQEIADAAAAAQ
ncbi:MAG: ABC transporter substrate-binding protein [Candidatus Limnocylindria bacterium]